MPFTIDITTTDLFNNFQSGDLLYGLKDVRKPYLDALREKTGQRHVTVDSYNNKVIIANLDLAEEYIDDPQQTLSTDEQDYKNYLLSHTKYAPTRIDPKSTNDNIKIKRACKAAIFWQSDNDKRQIHFCLDNINEVRVVSKWDNKAGKIDDAFTSSELRYIYKNWDKLSNKVIFYEEGKVVQAPWEANDVYWKNSYKQRSTYSNSLEASIEKIGKSKKKLVPRSLLFKVNEDYPVSSKESKSKKTLFKFIPVEANTTVNDSNDSNNTIEHKSKLSNKRALFKAVDEIKVMPIQDVGPEVNKKSKLTL